MKYIHLSKAKTELHGPGYVHALTEFGQPVELTEEQAAAHISQGASLLTESEVQELGFTPEELDAYRIPGLHDVDPEPDKKAAHEAFLEKRTAAWRKLHENRQAKLDQAKLDEARLDQTALDQTKPGETTGKPVSELFRMQPPTVRATEFQPKD